MQPVLPDFDVLGISLKTFGIFFALNFVAWGAVAARRLKELGKPEEWAYEMVLVGVVGGLVGAKLYYVIQHGAEFSLSGIVSGSGLVWYGGLIGGVILMLVWAERRGFRNLHLCDIAGICIPLGYAIGRIGCQVSGDGDYGTTSSLPWAMPYPDGTVPTTEDVHPTPIYETFAMGIVALGLWHLRDRVRPGIIFALYLILAGLERFLIEFIRRNTDAVAGLTAAQLWSVAMVIGGIAWIAVVLRRQGTLTARPALA
ncbi:MAG: phosphatidylglycerol---prolipoprotein diacylglyceryl transferase [Solirubrobacteraceae bacterium]|nr:phosphatidylglycerol---prolipoprotein diacylglyceryl transferase [Solirubrobacteraceae bacterium]